MDNNKLKAFLVGVVLRRLFPFGFLVGSIFSFSRANWLIGVILLIPAFLLIDDNFSPK